MKVFRFIFDRPYIILLITTLIFWVFSGSYVLFSGGTIISILGISTIYTAFQKKWLRLFISIICYFVYALICLFVLYFDEKMSESQFELGDAQFYSNEIKKTSKLKIPQDFKLISKIDTIFYMGMENEYDAECLYIGTSSSLNKFEKAIKAQKEFKQIKELDTYPSKVVSEINFNLKDLKSVYVKESDGRYTVHVAFNKNLTKFYYKAYYY